MPASSRWVSKKTAVRPVTDLPNVGKVISGKLNRIGIRTADQFLTRDPYDVFQELLIKEDPTLCRCALASLVGARSGKKWHLVTKSAAVEFMKRHPEHCWGSC